MRAFQYEKIAQNTWDSETLQLVAGIRECKGRQEMFLAQKPAVLKKLVEITKVQSTEASNKIEGIVTTSTRLKQLCEEKISPRNRDEEEISGYRDALNTIHENFEYILITPNYILQLHGMLYRYSGREIGGRFKNVQNYITETHTDGNAWTRFTPLAPYETPEAVAEICASYSKAIDDGVVDPLILIPILIDDFLCIHPFNDGNGRMSRLLTTLLLYQSGFVVGRYISLETKIEKTKDAYYDVLQSASVGWHDEMNDPTPLIKYLLGTILSAYRDFEDRVNLGDGKLPAVEQVRQAVKMKIGRFTKSEIMELCPGIGKTSVENSLKALVEDSFITPHGQGKATYYTRNK